MKTSGFLGKLIYWVNIVAAFLLLLSYVLPYIPPKTFSIAPLLSLAVSPLLFINVVFAVYWIAHLKRRALLSVMVLVIGYFTFGAFYQFANESEDTNDVAHKLKVLSYNVRLFNLYEEESDHNESSFIANLLKEQQPDIVCIQEFYGGSNIDFAAYPYQFKHFKEDHKLGHAIFSKYPLVQTGAFDFEDTYNNSLFADVLVDKDTVRLYNIHLQSLGILPSVDYLQQKNKTRIRRQMSVNFVKQQEQVTAILEHKKRTGYPVIIAGDMNNTAFSYVYKKLSKGMNDAFDMAGGGLGTTFSFDGYPMRIDYVMTSLNIKAIEFGIGADTFSDHYPIWATIGW